MRRRFLVSSSSETFDINNYLTMVALETISVSFNQDVEYAINGKKWATLSAGNSVIAMTGQKLSFRGRLSTTDTYSGIGEFDIVGAFDLIGNCMSLLFGDDAASNLDLSGKEYVFRGLFNGSDLRNVSRTFLPATTLADACYANMFSGCRSLTTAPELPATTLARDCYNSMFYRCTSLTTAPELPATTLADACYEGMFYECSKLSYIKALFTTTPSYDYTGIWVAGVASTGTFVKSKDATWDVVGNSGVPSGWTVITDDQEGGAEITFYVDDRKYTTSYGTTWEEYILQAGSRLFYNNGGDVYMYGSTSAICYDDGQIVPVSDVIKPLYNYTAKNQGAGYD